MDRTGQAGQLGAELALAALEASPDCVKLLDTDGVLLFMNERGVALNQLDTVDAVVGRPFAASWPPDQQRAIEVAVAGAAAGELTHVEGFCPTAKGEPRWWEVNFAPLDTDDGPRRIVAISRDVTARQEAELARRATERAYLQLNAELEERVGRKASERSSVWRVSPDLIVVIDGEGRFESTNPAWLPILGWTAEELAGLDFRTLVHPDDLAPTLAVWADAVERGIPALRFENRYRHKDGSWRWLSWVGVPENGRVYCTARDVTADKEQGAALMQAEEALRQSQKLEAVGQLTGGVAHDFNNLLTVIRGSVELLKRPNITDERRTRYVDAIGETADRAARLTGQLLAFSRRQTLKPELFDVGRSVEEVAGIVRSLIGSRVQLELHPGDAPVYVLADRSQFDTAIVNMAVNARDAMGAVGRLVIRTAAASGLPALRSHEAVEGEFVTVSVEDTGSGMDAETQLRIFEPFFTTKGVGQGTGLGLSQVFGFAKQSGGDVGVESRVGSGSVFTLYLPRAHAGAGAPAAAAEPETRVDGEGVCVLVVEDNASVAEFATAALKELGYNSSMAPDAESALEKLAASTDKVHVVFSDVVMPGMSGLEFEAEVRRRFPGVPVILTSGFSHVLAERGAQGLQMLQKPYSIEQLSRVLRRALA